MNRRPRAALGFAALTCAPALALLCALAVPRPAAACSQCLCGDPFPTTAFGAPVPATLRFGVESRLLSKQNGLDDGPGMESEREQRVAPFLLWTATPRLVVTARQTYAFKRIADRPEGGAEDVATSRGFGDGELMARYRAFDLGFGERGGRGYIAFLVGASAPTGRNDLRDGTGARLEEHLQTGLGAWSGTAGIDLAWPAPSALLELNVSERVNGANAHGFRYGNALLFDVGGTTRLTGAWQFLARVNGRVAQEDRVASDGERDPNSGGVVLYAAPGARWFTAAGIVLDLNLQVPVAQALDGTQKEHATARLAVSLAP